MPMILFVARFFGSSENTERLLLRKKVSLILFLDVSRPRHGQTTLHPEFRNLEKTRATGYGTRTKAIDMYARAKH